MSLLNVILEDHFISPEKEEIKHLLKKHGIDNLIEVSVSKLNEQIGIAVENSEKAPINAITTTSANLLVLINSSIDKVNNTEVKHKIQTVLSTIGVKMLFSIIKLFPDDSLDIYNAVKQGIEITANNFGYDFMDIEKRMNLKELRDLIATIQGARQATEIKQIKEGKLPYLKWTGRGNIGFLTQELKDEKWIKRQANFEKLFGECESDFKVYWDMKFVNVLALLLYYLKKEDFIRPIGSKGYFLIAERHICDFSGKPLKENSLKKISSKVLSNKAQNIDIHRKVEHILRLLERK